MDRLPQVPRTAQTSVSNLGFFGFFGYSQWIFGSLMVGGLAAGWSAGWRLDAGMVWRRLVWLVAQVLGGAYLGLDAGLPRQSIQRRIQNIQCGEQVVENRAWSKEYRLRTQSIFCTLCCTLYILLTQISIDYHIVSLSLERQTQTIREDVSPTSFIIRDCTASIR